MSYKLYLDRPENFTADVSVKNASLKNSIARLVVEADGINLIFKGSIQEQKCVIPIKKLKGILDENTRGKMYLEIIVEDIYFKPWESDFVVEEHTSMKVVVKEQTETTKPVVEVKVSEKEVIEESKPATITPSPKVVPKPVAKPLVKVPVPKKPKKNLNETAAIFTATEELLSIYKKVGLHTAPFSKLKTLGLLSEYFKSSPEFANKKREIARGFFNKVHSIKNRE